MASQALKKQHLLISIISIQQDKKYCCSQLTF
jgi:hypothetical protein